MSALADLIDMLRAKGVVEYDGPGPGPDAENNGRIQLRFHPPIDSTPAATQPVVDPDLCACGHAEHQHTNGLCVMGCAPEKCLGEAKP